MTDTTQQETWSLDQETLDNLFNAYVNDNLRTLVIRFKPSGDRPGGVLRYTRNTTPRDWQVEVGGDYRNSTKHLPLSNTSTIAILDWLHDNDPAQYAIAKRPVPYTLTAEDVKTFQEQWAKRFVNGWSNIDVTFGNGMTYTLRQHDLGCYETGTLKTFNDGDPILDDIDETSIKRLRDIAVDLDKQWYCVDAVTDKVVQKGIDELRALANWGCMVVVHLPGTWHPEASDILYLATVKRAADGDGFISVG